MDAADSPTLLVIAAPEHDATAYHLSGFMAPDPVIYLRSAGKSHLAVSAMEYSRAKREAQVDELVSFEKLELQRLARELQSGARAFAAAAAGMLDDLGVREASVPPSMPVAYADELRSRGVKLTPDTKLFSGLRRVKTEAEISRIEDAQRETERVCRHAIDILRESEVSAESTLLWRGETLTSELLRSEIEVELLRRGYSADAGTIVSGGAQAADPHERGNGPLRANESIILDIFPASKTSRYYADMTRTVVKGEPDAELRRMYEAVLEAQQTALGAIRAGVNGQEVHNEVSDILHEQGYKTTKHDQEEGKPLTEGFMHGTGHGVGLELHEPPRVSVADEELRAGDVITVEPGVYEPGVGGVRIEDLVVVTENGCRNLTDFPKELVL